VNIHYEILSLGTKKFVSSLVDYSSIVCRIHKHFIYYNEYFIGKLKIFCMLAIKKGL